MNSNQAIKLLEDFFYEHPECKECDGCGVRKEEHNNNVYIFIKVPFNSTTIFPTSYKGYKVEVIYDSLVGKLA